MQFSKYNNFNSYMESEYVLPVSHESIDQALSGIWYCIYNRKPILIAGNGGSAYTGAHFAQDINKLFRGNALSLSDNYGLIMAVANDISYDETFSFPLNSFLVNNKEKPLLVLISHSGNSKNIINAAKLARSKSVPVLSFTGNDGGELKNYSNLNVNVPTNNIFVSESIHSLICHYIIDQLHSLFGVV